ncbi:MAG: amidohydrolase family protein [Candidatus Bathyarchaeota archaeon]|nr:amidohydrolase family protein [Candidatus Bathyarchaeota archaeon]
MKAIKGGFLIDANGVRQKPVVLFEGERIVEVGSTGSVSIPSDAEVIDARDFFLMPGLVDCHVHFTGSDVGGPINFRESYENRLIRAAVHQTKQLLDAGFTSVMDAGGLIGLHVRNAVNEGIVSGPRVVAAGRYMSVTGGHGDTHYLPMEWVKEGRPFGWGMDGRIADGVDECIRAVREQLREGVDFIKICTSGGGGSLRDPPNIPEYTLEELEAMVHIAHSWGRRVMVHCYNPEGIKRSVTAGADIVAHGNMADEASIRLMKEHGTIVVPTMSVYHRMAQLRAQEGSTQPSKDRVRSMYSTLFEDVKRLHDGGLTLAAGTDTMGGTLPFGGNALELELYVERVGLNPLEAIKIGTLNGARAMGLEGSLGTLEAGKLADIIAVGESPLENINSLQEKGNIKLVIKDGEVLKNIL